MSEWIPVTERLPVHSRSVAILISDPDVAIHHWPTCAYLRVDFRGTKDERSVWWAGVPGKYIALPVYGWTVTHWAELPEMPAKREVAE